MRILIIEDDPNLSRGIRRCLAPAYDTDQASDGAEGLYCAQEGTYDLIILDIMLPELDGYTVLERLRAASIDTPVLILSALGTSTDKVKGFRKGADDYLVKPFDKEELLLRIEAILRRSLNMASSNEICFKELTLKPHFKKAYIADEPLDLKGRQYDVLEYLVSRRDTLITKKQLFDKVWGFLSDTSLSVVEVYISNLRKQLEPFGYDQYLKTIRGAGYLFSEADDA